MLLGDTGWGVPGEHGLRPWVHAVKRRPIYESRPKRVPVNGSSLVILKKDSRPGKVADVYLLPLAVYVAAKRLQNRYARKHIVRCLQKRGFAVRSNAARSGCTGITSARFDFVVAARG